MSSSSDPALPPIGPRQVQHGRSSAFAFWVSSRRWRAAAAFFSCFFSCFWWQG
ncbi:hypothetical protein [Kitasatospora sp. P5_F3]